MAGIARGGASVDVPGQDPQRLRQRGLRLGGVLHHPERLFPADRDLTASGREDQEDLGGQPSQPAGELGVERKTWAHGRRSIPSHFEIVRRNDARREYHRDRCEGCYPSSSSSRFSSLAGGGVAYWYAGRLPGPAIEIVHPERFVGVTTPLEVTVDAPGGELTTLEIVFEQNGARTPLFIHGSAAPDVPAAQVAAEGDRVRVSREIGRESVGGIRSAPRASWSPPRGPCCSGCATSPPRPRATSRCASSARASPCCRRITT